MIKKIFLLAIISALFLLIVTYTLFISFYGNNEIDKDKELLVGSWINGKNNFSTLIRFTIDGKHRILFSSPDLDEEFYYYEVLNNNTIKAYNDSVIYYYTYEFLNDDFLKLSFSDNYGIELIFKRLE
jgi:hypothetical protein